VTDEQIQLQWMAGLSAADKPEADLYLYLARWCRTPRYGNNTNSLYVSVPSAEVWGWDRASDRDVATMRYHSHALPQVLFAAVQRHGLSVGGSWSPYVCWWTTFADLCAGTLAGWRALSRDARAGLLRRRKGVPVASLF
jgi:hypothetical protein